MVPVLNWIIVKQFKHMYESETHANNSFVIKNNVTII